MVITNLKEFFIASFVLFFLFWIIKDISKTLICSFFEENQKESCNYKQNSLGKKSRRYRYDEMILENDDL